MIKITPDKKRNAQTFRHIKSLPRRFQAGVNRGFSNVGVNYKRSTKKSMRQKKHGREYLVNVGKGGRRLSRPRIHIASRVGESPAILTGELMRSLGFNRANMNMKWGANTPYAERLETKMGRHYLIEAVLKNRKETEQYLLQGIDYDVKRIRGAKKK